MTCSKSGSAYTFHSLVECELSAAGSQRKMCDILGPLRAEDIIIMS